MYNSNWDLHYLNAFIMAYKMKKKQNNDKCSSNSSSIRSSNKINELTICFCVDNGFFVPSSLSSYCHLFSIDQFISYLGICMRDTKLIAFVQVYHYYLVIWWCHFHFYSHFVFRCHCCKVWNQKKTHLMHKTAREKKKKHMRRRNLTNFQNHKWKIS